jgi:transposase
VTMTIASLDRADTGVVEEQPVLGARPQRRTFTAELRGPHSRRVQRATVWLRATRRAAAADGLYSSYIAEWRKAREEGARKGLVPKGKAKSTPEQAELDKLRRRNEALQAELGWTKMALEITGKAHAFSLAATETGELAKEFIADTLSRHRIEPDQLALHADRGTLMTSKPVASC